MKTNKQEICNNRFKNPSKETEALGENPVSKIVISNLSHILDEYLKDAKDKFVKDAVYMQSRD